MRILNFGLAAVFLFFSISVNASILSMDWHDAGDNLITHDTVSGLNWLDITVTNGLSYNDVNAQLENGDFAGFRYATGSEVIALWANFGVDLSLATGVYNSFEFGGLDPGISEAASFIGNLPFEDHLYYVKALYDQGDWDPWVAGASYTNGWNNSSYTLVDDNKLDKNISYANLGSYLVEGAITSPLPPIIPPITTPVPVPASVWLFVSGLIFLTRFAKRNNHKY